MSCRQFTRLPKIDPDAPDCFRWNPARKLYEVVLGGEVVMTVSRLVLSDPKLASRWRAEVLEVMRVHRFAEDRGPHRENLPGGVEEQARRHG